MSEVFDDWASSVILETTEEHLLDGNIFISYSPADDILAGELYYKFIGVSKIGIGEVHIWQIKTLEEFNAKS